MNKFNNILDSIKTAIMGVDTYIYIIVGITVVFLLSLFIILKIKKKRKKAHNKAKKNLPVNSFNHVNKRVNTKMGMDTDDSSVTEITAKLPAGKVKVAPEATNASPTTASFSTVQAPKVACVFSVERSIMYLHTSEEIV